MQNIPAGESYELSPLQQGMLIHTLRETGVGMYISQAVFTLTGVDPAAFAKAWQKLVDRHSILRSSFVWEGLDRPLQQVHANVKVEMETDDWRDMTSQGEREARFREFLREDRERGFDLTVPPLMRLFLIRRSETNWFFVFSHHHLLLDGWSNPILMGELRRLYEAERRGRTLELPPARPYRQYIEWLRAQDSAKAEAFWRQHLAGIRSPTPLPGDLGARRRAVSRLHYGEWETQLDETLVHELQRLARSYQVTLNTLLLASWAVLLSRYNREPDVLIGMLVSGRPASLEGVESMIGMFLNTLPCRIRVDEQAPLGKWLATLQEQQFELQQYEYSPLRSIQEWSDFPPGMPLFDCVVDNNNTPLERSEGVKTNLIQGGVARKEVTSRAVHQNIPFHLDIEASGAELVMTITFDARRFEQAAVVRVSEQYRSLLREITENPDRCLGDLSMMSARERDQVLVDWNNTQRPFPTDICLHELFEHQVERTPKAAAGRYEGQELTYSELNARANRLAAHLRENGARPGKIVGLCVRRSLDMATAVLSILKSGACYLPLDPAFPPARLAFIIEDAGVTFVVAEQATRDKLPTKNASVICIDRDQGDWNARDSRNLARAATPNDLAYVLYTSGSTGRPKGVAIPHRVPVARMYAEADPFEPNEAVCAKTTLNFVDSVWELFSPWRHGLCCTLVPENDVKDPPALIETLAGARATRIVLVPSLLRAILDSGEDLQEKLPKLRHWISSGEPLPSDLCKRFSQALPGAVLTNLYGTSEVWDVTRCDSRQRGPGEPLPIGRPIPNARVYVLDERQRPVPVGVPGELHVAGAYLASGYWNRPHLTARRFIPDPFDNKGGRLYRTGDLVRWLPDGNLEYLGRLDQQIKVRGFRIEITEIEGALRLHEDVRQVAIAVTDDDRLAAYVVPQNGRKADGKELQEFLASRLPAHMVPVFYKMLDALPLTPTGKIDRRALPQLEAEDRHIIATATDEARGLPAFETQTEEQIGAIWSKMLGVTGLTRDSHFFELGGHSLMAMRVAMQLGKDTGVKVPIGRIFELPVLAGLANWIDQTRAGEKEAEHVPELERARRGKEAPVSFAQQRMWVLDQLNPGSVSYSVPNFIRFVGQFDVQAIRKALTDMVGRHESLRTTFMARDGEPYQIVHPSLKMDLPLVDLTGLPEEERDAAAHQRMREQSRIPWDLTNGPLFRAQILRLAPDRHDFALTMHHIITDGRSMGIFTRELSILYRAARQGTPPNLQDLPIQYADFAIWQRDWMKGELLEKQIGYWKTKLGDAALLDLPTDHPRPVEHRYRGKQGYFQIATETAEALRNLARAEDATMFMVLLAGFQILLARYAGHRDISVGTPSANRNREELETIIGFFVNVLVIRSDLSGNPSFRQLLQQVRKTCIDAYDNQDVPFDKLVEVLNPQRDLSGQPLFQTMFVYELAKRGPMELPGIKWEHRSAEMETANFDLLLVAKEFEDDITCTLQYNSDLFEPLTIERMCQHLSLLFKRIAALPDRHLSTISMLSEEERNQVIFGWNDTHAPAAKDRCIHDLIAEHADKEPDALSLWFEGQELSRRDLDKRANRLANRLLSLGCGPETIIGLCMPRSLGLIESVLGILKSGSAFLPLDPDYPTERLDYMIADSGVKFVVASKELTDRLEVARDKLLCLDDPETNGNAPTPADHRPESEALPSNLAYVIYTSGSTGTPKGVQIEHRNLTSLVQAQNPAFRIGPKSRVLQMLSISFDAGVGEIFRALAGGAPLFLAHKDQLLPGPRLVELIRSLHITTAAIPPAVLAAMPRGAEDQLPELDVLITAGEAFSPELAQRWGRGRHIITGHGATETTVGDTIAVDWQLERKPPLGVPLPNMKAYVLDGWMQPVPINAPGELYVSGPQVGRGYLGNPKMTAEKFLPDPFSSHPGSRMYRTGDLVRWLSNGNLDFIRRADQQVKIRGYRIELGEIESVLSEHPLVGQCVVDVAQEAGGKRLVGYFVSVGQERPGIADLRAYLKQRLPDHMVPAFLMGLPEMPLTPNNKIDRRALPRPDAASISLDAEYVAPRNNTEKVLAGLWAEVLGLERIGVDDNFFELGGDSIMSIQVVARANKVNLALTARDLFQHQTVAELAQKVASGGSVVEAEQGMVTGETPLTPVQQWFFEAEPAEPNHYNQWLSRSLPGNHSPEHMKQALHAVLGQHDALRLRIQVSDGGRKQQIPPLDDLVPFEYFDLSDRNPDERAQRYHELSERLQCGLDLAEGPIIRAGWFDFGDDQDGRLLIAIHHLACDNVSWPIIMEDFFSAYRQIRAGQRPRLQLKTTSFKQWAETLTKFAASAELHDEIPYWIDSRRALATPLPRDFPNGGISKASTASLIVRLDPHHTEILLRTTLRRFKVKITDVLLTALGTALCHWAGRQQIVINVEGHGREEIGDDINVARTVGWFTSFYPALLDLDLDAPAISRLSSVHEQIEQIPNRGMGYALLRYLSPDEHVRSELAEVPDAEVALNYTGQQARVGNPQSRNNDGSEEAASDRREGQIQLSENREGVRRHPIEIVGAVLGGELTMRWAYSLDQYQPATFEQVTSRFIQELREIAKSSG